ncbi:hypothetical protein [Spirosoma koreense]
MTINEKSIVGALLIATLATVHIQAQNQPVSSEPIPLASNGPDGPPTPPGGPGRRPGRPEGPDQGPGRRNAARGLTSLTTVSGTVGQWIGNDEAILDGFTLTNGSATTTVKFPPHLGQQVQKATKPGGSVSITGYAETTPTGETLFRMNSLTAGKTTVLDSPPMPATTAPETPSITTVSGKIADYRLNREGRISGLVMEDKTIVTIPPHVAYQLADLAKKGSAITVQGYAKPIHDGQVQLDKLNILRASVLTINGQQYLVR